MTEVFSEKRLVPIFAKYVSLNMLSTFALSLYILADTFFVANGVGNGGLVALNLALPLFSVLNGMGNLFGIGGSTVYSIAKGSGESKKSERIFTEVMLIAALTGVILTLVFTLAAEPLSKALGANESTDEHVTVYLRTLGAFSLPFIINVALNDFVRNDGSPNIAMAGMLTSSFSNILLDYVFVFPLNMGMFGASLATGLSPVLAIAVLSIHFFKKSNKLKFSFKGFEIKDYKKVFGIGVNVLISELATGTVILVYNLVILDIADNVALGAYSVIANIALVAVAVLNGLGEGIQPLTSYFHGSGNKKTVKKILLMAFGAAFVVGVLLYIFCIFGKGFIIDLFNKDGIEELAVIAERGMTVYCSAFLFMCFNLVGAYFLSSVAKGAWAFVISLIRGFILPLPILLTLPYALGMEGVWWTVPIADGATLLVTALTIWLYFRKKREKSYA